MADLYGMRTRDSAGAVSLDTTVTAVRSIYSTQVQGRGSTVDQYFSIPQIRADSFVVVTNSVPGLPIPAAWWSTGQLQLRRPNSQVVNVMVLSYFGLSNGQELYGIRSKNDSSYIQVDNVSKVLTVAQSGSFRMGLISSGNAVADVVVNFPAPITTVDQPLVFLNAGDYMMVYKFVLRGSPGNWTGFSLSWFTAPISNQSFTVKWMAGVFKSTGAPGQYGARVRGADGSQLFTTSDNIIQLTGFPSADRFVKTGSDLSYGARYYTGYRMPWTGNFNDYFLANSVIGGGFTDGAALYDNPVGFFSGDRNYLQAYSGANANTTGSANNGRTVFAGRPVRAI